MAARVAHYFDMDPVVVLRSGLKDHAIRQASYNYMQELEEASRAKAEADSKARRNR